MICGAQCSDNAMRVLVALQGAQTESRNRGIGRYSLSLARAMAAAQGAHDLWICLNASFLDTVDPLKPAFTGVVPPERSVTFKVPRGARGLDPSS